MVKEVFMNSRASKFIALACSLALTSPFALAAKADKNDAKALQDLAQANMAEVQAGKLASQKAQNPEVKKFARHMVEDHGKQLGELKQIAQARQVTLPAAPKPKHQEAMKKLQDLSGDEFDRAYMTQMVKDHGEALTLAQKTAKQAKDDELKAAAKKAEPAIRQHLDTAQKLAGLTGAKSQ
jgi:putative membrane protein